MSMGADQAAHIVKLLERIAVALERQTEELIAARADRLWWRAEDERDER